ncbi:hypothetical protein [Trinickia mobilis]|uniref:hypothetical protein n=1 Tax=Trinickia mobilis TaxID=2816356 RepID=UPI001A8F91AC|nr:hypothetical protein [Trinickia mobilis]
MSTAKLVLQVFCYDQAQAAHLHNRNKQNMNRWTEVVLRLLRHQRTRVVVSFAGLIIASKIATYGWGAKLLGAALFIMILWEMSSEWRGYLPAFRRTLFRRMMRIMKALRPLRKLPPEVPVLYGAVMMYMIVRIALASQHWLSPLPSTYETAVIGLAISVGALSHTHSILARVARWSWSKVLGKALYAVATAACVAIGTADATRMTRLLAHADAKYFPSFLGLLSSWYVVLDFVRCIAVFLFACGLILLLINLPSLFLRFARNYVRFLPNTGTNRLFLLWRRMRFGRSTDPALAQGKYIRDVVELFTPLALLILASLVINAPDWIMKAQPTGMILDQTLLAMEYTADGGCPNVLGNLPTVHLDGDFVSVATVVNGRLSTTRQTCHIVQQPKS